VNTDAAHSWLRATMREVGDVISKARTGKEELGS
jgi:hypothetical protein